VVLKLSVISKLVALAFNQNQIPPIQRICQWTQITTQEWNITLSDADEIVLSRN
jgi:hypothetical protein